MSQTSSLPADTDAAAYAAQIAVYRRMGGDRRLEIALALSDEVREITLAGIRARHPEYSVGEARHALFLLLSGEKLYRAAYPGRPLLRPCGKCPGSGAEGLVDDVLREAREKLQRRTVASCHTLVGLRTTGAARGRRR